MGPSYTTNCKFIYFACSFVFTLVVIHDVIIFVLRYLY